MYRLTGRSYTGGTRTSFKIRVLFSPQKQHYGAVLNEMSACWNWFLLPIWIHADEDDRNENVFFFKKDRRQNSSSSKIEFDVSLSKVAERYPLSRCTRTTLIGVVYNLWAYAIRDSGSKSPNPISEKKFNLWRVYVQRYLHKSNYV